MTKTPNFKRGRPTIGVLAGWSTPEGAGPDHYRTALIRGIQSAARSRQCNLLLGRGNRLLEQVDQLYPSWPELSPETDFVPIGHWNTDGLIVFSPLGNRKQSRYLQQLRAQGFPILFIGSGEQGPQIAVNNEVGIRQAIAHLVEHGHRRIAFLAGRRSDEGDSQARLRAYQTAMAEHNLKVDPKLVAWGWHDAAEGYKAMGELLKTNAKFTALVASNDISAVGAMQAIQDAGMKVPQQIAIIGFDDYPGAIAQVPPLTSVHVPLRLIGEQALLLMAEHLQGRTALESIKISPRLVKRQSCGCLTNALPTATPEVPTTPIAWAGRLVEIDHPQLQQQLVDEMMTIIPSELRFPDENQIQPTCTAFVRAFCTSLKEKNPNYFTMAFMESVHRLELADANLDYWQEMISSFRVALMQLPLLWRQDKIRSLAEHMLHQARTMIAESAQRQHYHHEYMHGIEAGAVNFVTARLSAALTNAQVVDVLNTDLPRIGIRHARLIFYEPDQDDPVGRSVVPGTSEDGSLDRSFPSREFPPPGLYAPDELLNVLLFPLVFQGEILGYTAFEASNIEACTVIARQLAATLMVSRLHAQVVELSLTDPLTHLHNRRYLDLFLANEIARGRRFANKLSIIMADIDDFKAYNDRFGHLAGDLVLQQVANCLTKERRSIDVLARVGGEEFVALLPETDLQGALICAEKMRLSVAALARLKRPITISLGVATFNRNIDRPEVLLQRADQALYEAKQTGRNRVCIYQEK